MDIEAEMRPVVEKEIYQDKSADQIADEQSMFGSLMSGLANFVKSDLGNVGPMNMLEKAITKPEQTSDKLKQVGEFAGNVALDVGENVMKLGADIGDAIRQAGLPIPYFKFNRQKSVIPGASEGMWMSAEEGLAEREKQAKLGDATSDMELMRIGDPNVLEEALEPMASFLVTMFIPALRTTKMQKGVNTSFERMFFEKGMQGDALASATLDLEDGNIATFLKDLGIQNDVIEYLSSRPEDEEVGFERLLLRTKNVMEEGAFSGLLLALPYAFRIMKANKVKFMAGGAAIGTFASGEEAEAAGLSSMVKLGKVISSRLPTAVNKTEDPFATKLSVNLDDLKQDERLFNFNVGITQDYPNMQNLGNQGNELSEQFVDHVKNNLLYLYDETPEVIRNRSKQWYVGANKVVNDMAARYGIADTSVSGVMASLSPQKDWYQNASLGIRTIDIVKEKANEVFDPKMVSTFKSIKALNKPAYAPFLKMLEGKKLGEVMHPDPKIQSNLRSIWVRIYDETYNDKSYKILSPEGEFLDNAKTIKGENAEVSWGSLVEISKALNSIEANGDINKISETMGMRHKVRNFFNNISDPNNPSGDVTVDTHAVAGGLLRPLSGKSLEVDHNFKNQTVKGRGTTKGSALSGIYGNYPLYVEAYQRAARERGVLPREMQSITWEASRGLFTPTFKGNAKNVEEINKIWYRFKNGDIDETEARNLVKERSGGINLPEWAE